MLCRTSTLRNAQRQAERREEALFGFMRECLDRVAALADKPWTLPPRPVEPREPKPDPIAAQYGLLED